MNTILVRKGKFIFGSVKVMKLPTIWKFQRLRRKLLHMRSDGWFGMFVFILFLEVMQSGSSKLGTSATIQNRDTVQHLGKPESEVYQTSQNLRITASFASNGSLCQAHIGSGLDARITDTQLNGVWMNLHPKTFEASTSSALS